MITLHEYICSEIGRKMHIFWQITNVNYPMQNHFNLTAGFIHAQEAYI